MQWESVFQEHILHRGFNYYERGVIHHLEVSTSQLKAEVDGSNTYTVEINYQATEKLITGLSCNCPHYESGYFCKHLASFLFYLENKFKDFADLKLDLHDVFKSNTQNRMVKDNISQLVSEADENTVRKFLIEVLENSSTLKNQFKGRLGHEITTKEIEEYKRTIDYIFKSHGSGQDNFIDYYSSMDLESDLNKFMREKIGKLLLKNDYYDEAFELVNKIFLKLVKQPIDDSAGSVMDIAYDCENYWSQIIDKSSIEIKLKMYDWFKE